MSYQMSDSLALILGSAAGTFLIGISIILFRYCIFRYRSSLKSSEWNSSDDSVQVEQTVELSMRATVYPPGYQGAWCFTLDELMAATKSFSEINLLGYGNYGEVYKGLLDDGTLVAVKRRIFSASQEFVQQVQCLSLIRHCNLVSLLGYCQESDFQMLVYEYVNNGSISSYLYGTGQALSEKLDFKHRLSIALGAAKGLEYLHSFNPPLLHMNFRTANVLVDQDFVPKVADAGLKSLLDKLNGAGPSSYEMDCDLFLDPGVKDTGIFTMKSDVYSFGVFLLELVSGRGATSQASDSNESISEWRQNYRNSNGISPFVDQRMRGSYSLEVMRDFLRLIRWCLDPSVQIRPQMHSVVSELERLLDREIGLTAGGVTPTVTLGSQLFTD